MHAFAFADSRGPKVVLLLLEGREVRGQEVPLCTIELRVLRGDVDDVAEYVTVELAQLQSLDDRTWSLSTGKPLPEPLPAYLTALEQNTPNPFNPTTEIRYSVAHESPVTLAIYNVQGRLIRLLVDAHQHAGRYHVPWNGKDRHGNPVPSGIYLYRLTAGSAQQMRKLVLVR